MATRRFDLAEDPGALHKVLTETKPGIVIHFAEQRSAPYSMESADGARYSVDNNIRATHNILAGLVQAGLDTHLVHLGTIGVYGYGTANLCLPEGYLTAKLNGTDGREIEREILYPGEPVSIYHLTKVLDQTLSAFYARHYGLRITELHQGVVWGTQTEETQRDPRLVNRFDYDAVYGTVVNRFLVQAFLKQPLSVYGTGRQTRAFIHIEDMLTCIRMAAETPPQRSDRVRIVNQFSETCRIIDLARQVADISGGKVAHIPNPRQEPDDNELDVARNTLDFLGFAPGTFDTRLAAEFQTVADLIGEMPKHEIRSRGKVA